MTLLNCVNQARGGREVVQLFMIGDDSHEVSANMVSGISSIRTYIL